MTSSSPLQPWRCLNSRTAFTNRWVRVNVDDVALPDGRTYEYTVLRRDRHGAAVLAFNEQGQVLMQQEYRYPVDAVIWQVPGGLIDPGESPLAAAQRELAEETGHIADRWYHLGSFWDNPAFEDMVVNIFVAEDARPDGSTHRDEAEWVRHEWKDLQWVRQQVRDGVIRERVVIAALGFLWARAQDQ